MMHHAYIYEGALGELESLARDAQERFRISDIEVESFESFGVDDARELSRRASLRVEAQKLFIVGAGAITTEAQQALLKLLEEPQEGVVFVLLLPYGVALQTIRSRAMSYPQEFATPEAKSTDAKKFLSLSYKERSAFITALLKDEEGTKERVREFLLGLERLLYKSISKSEVQEGLSEISLVRTYLSDRSPSLKMLLEHLAAVLPHITA